MWGLTVNSEKSKILSFGKGKKKERGWFLNWKKLGEVDHFRSCVSEKFKLEKAPRRNINKGKERMGFD